MQIDSNVQEMEELFSRGVGEFIDPEGKFKEKLGKKMRGEYKEDIIIKIGADPTRPDIHLGHAVLLRKLRKLQDFGCKVVFLVGDYTAQIGDPSGKNKVRPEIEQQEIEKNAKTYIEQVGKILRTDPSAFSWIRNSEWFYGVADLQPKNVPYILFNTALVNPKSFVGKAILYEKTRMQKTHLKKREIYSVTLKSLLWTLRHISLARLMQRDLFQERIKNSQELYLHEMLYPVLQGIDSFMIANIYGSCDLEIGGTDQTFNMVIGRDIMKVNKKFPQAVLSLKLLEGLDGKEKMSKSLDNYIAISDAPGDMYGKVMSIPDSSIVNYFILATYTPLTEIDLMGGDIKNSKIHPKDLKMRLAREIVAIYHGEEKAKSAEENFRRTFEKKGAPEEMLEVQTPQGSLLSDLLLSKGIVESKSDFRRLVLEGAIGHIHSEEKITDPKYAVSENIELRIGKKRFVRIRVVN